MGFIWLLYKRLRWRAEVDGIPQVYKKWRLNKKMTKDHTLRSFSLKSCKAMKDPRIGREICYILRLIIWLCIHYITLLLIFFDNFKHLYNIVWLLLTLLSALSQPCQSPFLYKQVFFFIFLSLFFVLWPIEFKNGYLCGNEFQTVPCAR